MPGVTYVIIAAVENYSLPKEFPKVDFATKDSTDFAKALVHLGFEKDDIFRGNDSQVTRASLIQLVKKITQRATKEDRIFFYFAGHGVYEEGVNYLAPFDASKTAVKDTCVPINDLLGLFKKSKSSKIVLFLDSCHSGFEAGTYIRDATDSFMAEELIYQFKDEDYCIGFASCKSDQTSVSHVILKNGVWSHFLVRALKGEGGKIYESGLLFSDQLQRYLKQETAAFVKTQTTDRKDQTPITFGNQTDRFLIADLNNLFEEKERTRKVETVKLISISMYSEDEGRIKNLPGFIKKFFEPTYYNSTSQRFVKDISKKLIEDEIDELYNELKVKLKYKKTEISASAEDGVGLIETPDFEYSLTIEQSESDVKEYILTRKLEKLNNADVINGKALNEIFNSHFDHLSLELPKKIDIEDLIEFLEDMDDDQITVTYPKNYSYVAINMASISCMINVTAEQFNIVANYATSPSKLLSAYAETQKVLLSKPDLKLLG